MWTSSDPPCRRGHLPRRGRLLAGRGEDFDWEIPRRAEPGTDATGGELPGMAAGPLCLAPTPGPCPWNLGQPLNGRSKRRPYDLLEPSPVSSGQKNRLPRPDRSGRLCGLFIFHFSLLILNSSPFQVRRGTVPCLTGLDGTRNRPLSHRLG